MEMFEPRNFKSDIVQWTGARNLHISQFYLTISFLNIQPIVEVAQIAIAATKLYKTAFDKLQIQFKRDHLMLN